jgi:uncharacterized membrane protein YtjA (UPF0391 family)
MKKLQHDLFICFLIIAAIAFALGFTAGIESAGRNAENVREATR